VAVGYRVDAAACDDPGPPAADGFAFDATLAGNLNEGHDGPAYGTDLSPGERADLLEYLKTL
jgi:hypothetical protein